MPSRILLIEDNPANLELISYLLEAHRETPAQPRRPYWTRGCAWRGF